MRHRSWELVNLPDHKKSIAVKWVYKIKLNPDGTVNKYKARLVAKGFLQQHGLNVMLRDAVLQGHFIGYKVGNLTVSHLQFADDTLILGDKRSLNIWTIKVVLQLFEGISGLKVNFYKSKLFGINVRDEWL